MAEGQLPHSLVAHCNSLIDRGRVSANETKDNLRGPDEDSVPTDRPL
jgi:hypothetical protein